jgi:hypothetical protein
MKYDPRQRVPPRQRGDVERHEEDPDARDQEAQPRAAAGKARDDGDVERGREGRGDVRHRLADAVHQTKRIGSQLGTLGDAGRRHDCRRAALLIGY